MTVAHRDIPEDGLHEPKGASTASADRVYVSDGSGSGNWERVSASSLQGSITEGTPQGRRVVTDGSGGFASELTSASAFGTINLTGNSTSKSVTAASDSDLRTPEDFVELDIALDFESVQNMSTGSNSLIVDQDGLYLVNFWCNISSSVNTSKVALTFVRNDTSYIVRAPKMTLSASSQAYNMSANGIHSFSSGDEVKIYVAADKATSITIEDMTFQMVYLGGVE